ncbi:MAG: hypothetical protein ACR2HZ_10065 [Gemmatimonadaceae bacterium]
MRDWSLTITIEQHDDSATLYVAGDMGISGALRIVRLCERLPTTIRMVRLDLRAVHDTEDGAMTVLETRLCHWRPGRGRIHVTGPALGVTPRSAPFRISGR